ncbi:NFX1-type zinc finger-containing protein 1 isoform X3 [Halyomorpha halys]|uniref:NFX1-type zinc finger-containing protein 1 isoform X3 n=1 Tax=Halyomorpha halys TaxID=286706 RepID=UPI0006D520BA|nr:NFX1-type zinc finger-containing protein 1 isoform X5 [Halyomorpha halys]
MIKSKIIVRPNPKDDLSATEISLQSLFCLFSTSDANFIADLLLKRKCALEDLTKSNLNSEQLIDLLKSFVNVYNLKSSHKRSQLLASTHSEEFVNNIKNFLQCNKNDEYLKETIYLIMYFIDANINELPKSDVCYNRFYSLLKVLLDGLPEDKFNDIFLWAHELRVLLQEKIIHRDRTKPLWKNSNIYPCPVDLFEKRELMTNKVNGAYKNIDEYLDTIFTLLKEDYEGCLREGILQMKAELRGTKTTEKEVFVYNNVNIERIEADEKPMNGIIHRIAFSVGDKENQLVNINKPFMYGSLLLLSRCSQFTTFDLATVVEDVELQNTEGNSYKVLKVSFVSNISQIKPYWRYTMLETQAPFNPYYKVLNAIQSKGIEKFPMKKYIVYSDTTPDFPRYISTETEYKIDCESVKLFSNTAWPSNLLNLDPSQIEALRVALTHELVLIQGPPGSGKTHLAQTIIDILIDNKNFLSTPILLISSDNRSVDVILETLAIKKRNVVRIGKQTKSSVLKKHLLNNKMKPCGRDIKIKIERIKESLLRKINQNEENIEKLVERLKREQISYRNTSDEKLALQILSAEVEVIGGTTASCARLHHLMEKVHPEVVIVENANEVLEAHVIAALSEGCKHLILIGDHKQLKPNISNRNLENYDLDVSLFERMMRCGMKCSTLTEQHRMRPEIASLLSPTVYQKMKYHPVVLNLPKIRGMQRNIFFINHEVAENKKKDDEHSYSNRYEADFLLGIANYLCLQGYALKDLTILVPYAEQLKYMIRASKTYPLLKGVEILTINTYSGHENTIILLSLVRSQSAGIGFLSNNNKIVVALSRAKSGLYIIGNMKTLMSGSDLWVSLNAVLKKKQAIDRSIHLECVTHKTITEVSNKQDFKLCSNRGGCILQCNLPLGCGHLCQLKCHPLLEDHTTYICSECGQCNKDTDVILPCGHSLKTKHYADNKLHTAYICIEPCARYCKQNLHQCKKKCHEECGHCYEDIDVILPCSHSSKKKCCIDKEEHIATYVCNEPTLRFCEQGLHKHVKKCYEEYGKCYEDVDVILPCGHWSKKKCYVDEEEHIAAFVCNELCLSYCKQDLHQCYKKCNEEYGLCDEDVDVILPCGHVSMKKCSGSTKEHVAAYICSEPCSRCCEQGLHKCGKKCYEECGKCYEDVDVILPCGHWSKKKCYVDEEEHIAAFVCNELCLSYCKQDLHQYYKKCNEEYGLCAEDVDVILPCGHVSKKKCSGSTKEHVAACICSEPCSRFCEQGLHKCIKKCYEECGNCNEDVDVILSCGHWSKKKCYVDEEEHIAAFVCNELCLRFCEQDLHKCNKRCYEECGKCNEDVDVIQPCGHSSRIKCYTISEKHTPYVCNESCLRFCEQGLHKCIKKCYEECGKCNEDVDAILPCGHLSKKKCYVDEEEHIAAFVCNELCLRFCEQGLHKCIKKCYEECGKCNEDVDVILPCGHSSKKKCCVDEEEHIAAFVCNELCLRFCEQDLHKCNKRCHEECGKCNEVVAVTQPCGHPSQIKCYAINEKYTVDICNESCLRFCKQNLHQCKKKCNEECGLCYEDVDLILPCGHLSKMKCCTNKEEHIAAYVCNEPCSRLCKQNVHKCKKKCYEECGQCNEEVDVILPCSHSSKKKCCSNKEETDVCMKPTVVSYLFCFRKVVPCWQSTSCFYRKVEEPA